MECAPSGGLKSSAGYNAAQMCRYGGRRYQITVHLPPFTTHFGSNLVAYVYHCHDQQETCDAIHREKHILPYLTWDAYIERLENQMRDLIRRLPAIATREVL
jgi:hypothetical protein